MKKILSAVLMAAMVLSMAGCNENAEAPEATNESTKIATTTTAAEKDDGAGETTTVVEDSVNEETTVAEEEERKLPELVFSDKYFADIDVYSEGKFAAQDLISGLWGYIDTEGNWVIEPQYYGACPFLEGLACVKNSSGLFDFIDESNNVVFTLAPDEKICYSKLGAGFYNGQCIISYNDGDLHKIVDKNGNTIKDGIPFFDGYAAFAQGLAFDDVIVSSTGELYDYEFNLLYDCRVEKANGEYFLVSDQKLFGIFDVTSAHVIDKNGNVAFYLSDLEDFPTFENADLKTAMSQKTNHLIISRTINGIQTCAVYDMTGKKVVDYKYKTIVILDDNLMLVTNNADNIGIVDFEGNEYLPFSPDRNFFGRTNDNYDTVNNKEYRCFNNSKTGKTEYFDISSRCIVEDDKNLSMCAGYFYSEDNMIFDYSKNRFYISISAYHINDDGIYVFDSIGSITLKGANEAKIYVEEEEALEMINNNLFINYDSEQKAFNLCYVKQPE